MSAARVGREALTHSAVNLLGAVADAVSDATAASVAARAGVPGTDAVALSALLHLFETGRADPRHRPSVDRLREVLGLTHSGAVRLLDRLEREGLVRRTRGDDGRSRLVSLTPRGRRRAHAVSDARAEHLGALLAGWDPDDVATLHRLLGGLAERVVAGKDGGAWICRRCDLEACGRAERLCPVANAAVAKYALPDSALDR